MTIPEINENYGIQEEGENEDPVSRALNTQGMQINHAPVEISDHRTPFISADQLDLFKALLDKMKDEDLVPKGYGVRREELEGGVYVPFQHIRSGIKGGGRDIHISLPFEVWNPRLERWAQGHYAMNTVQAS